VCVCVCVVLRVRFCILNNNNKIPQSVFSIYCEPKSLPFHLQILQICINYLLPTSLGLYPGLTPNLIVRALVQPFTAIHPKQIISPSKPIMDLVALRRPVWAKPGIPQNWTALSPVPCIGGGVSVRYQHAPPPLGLPCQTWSFYNLFASGNYV